MRVKGKQRTSSKSGVHKLLQWQKPELICFNEKGTCDSCASGSAPGGGGVYERNIAGPYL